MPTFFICILLLFFFLKHFDFRLLFHLSEVRSFREMRKEIHENTDTTDIRTNFGSSLESEVCLLLKQSNYRRLLQTNDIGLNKLKIGRSHKSLDLVEFDSLFLGSPKSFENFRGSFKQAYVPFAPRIDHLAAVEVKLNCNLFKGWLKNESSKLFFGWHSIWIFYQNSCDKRWEGN